MTHANKQHRHMQTSNTGKSNVTCKQTTLAQIFADVFLIASNLKEDGRPDELGDDALANALLADQAAELMAARAAAEVNPAMIAALVATTADDDLEMADAVSGVPDDSGALNPDLASEALEQSSSSSLSNSKLIEASTSWARTFSIAISAFHNLRARPAWSTVATTLISLRLKLNDDDDGGSTWEAHTLVGIEA